MDFFSWSFNGTSLCILFVHFGFHRCIYLTVQDINKAIKPGLHSTVDVCSDFVCI